MCQFDGFLPVATIEPSDQLDHQKTLNATTPEQKMLQELVDFAFPGQPSDPPSNKVPYSPLQSEPLSDAMIDDLLVTQFYTDIPVQTFPDPLGFDSWLCFADLEPLPLLKDYKDIPLLLQQKPLQARQACSNCATQSTPLWRKNHKGIPLCNVPPNLIKGLWHL
jgi:hypothetical protein